MLWQQANTDMECCHIDWTKPPNPHSWFQHLFHDSGYVGGDVYGHPAKYGVGGVGSGYVVIWKTSHWGEVETSECSSDLTCHWKQVRTTWDIYTLHVHTNKGPSQNSPPYTSSSNKWAEISTFMSTRDRLKTPPLYMHQALINSL